MRPRIFCLSRRVAKTAPAPAAPAQQGVKTIEQVLEEFRQHGVTVLGWARANNFDRSLVKDVLYGRVKGNYGKGHEIAVALGLKNNVGAKPDFLKKVAE